MTVIVYRDGVLAADTAAWQGDLKIGDDKKAFKLADGTLYACAGSLSEIMQFRQWMDAGQPNPKPAIKEAFGAIIVNSAGQTFRVIGDSIPYLLDRPWLTEGSHDEFLNGLLVMGADAETAVTLAIRHCGFAGGVLHSVRLSNRL